MPAEEVLNQLHDIQLPPPMSWWPLPYGWYLLLLLIVIVVMMGLWWVKRRQRLSAGKRYAVEQLIMIQHAYAERRRSPIETCQDISILLRRVALAYGERTDVANLTGDDWIAFLANAHAGWRQEPHRSLVQYGPYAKSLESLPESFFTQTKNWIDAYV